MNGSCFRCAPDRGARRIGAAWLALTLAALACTRSDLPMGDVTPLGGGVPFTPSAGGLSVAANTPIPGLPSVTPRPTLDVSLSPTPDATRASALSREIVETYVVAKGDTLNQIGQRYGVDAEQIAQANGITVFDTLHIGQALLIPLPEAANYGPELKLLPDSEFVHGPGAAAFNVGSFVDVRGGYLANYAEDVPGFLLDGQAGARLTGAEIVQTIAERYSVSPRLLLAVIEFQSGWVTNPRPGDGTLAYPLRRVEVGREGLFRQLSWAANQLNLGYYGWRSGWLVSLVFDSGGFRIISPGLNAGTAGVQHFFAKVQTADEWTRSMSAAGFDRVYQSLFGNPFRLAVEPLVPAGLTQPEMALPFETGKVWAFTGGPHGAWDTGSAWAALDFAPPAGAEGCVKSEEWITASAAGIVVRSSHGAVIVDLDEDGFEGTGWAIFYMHVEARDRVAVGTRVGPGDRLGHPSCEGGVSNGTHLHIARKYNGEWIPADGAIPFVLDGWVSAGLGREYDGLLSRLERTIEACDCRAASNEIARP